MIFENKVVLILAGGKSSRMGKNKAEIFFEGKPQLLRLVEFCEELQQAFMFQKIVVSCTKEQVLCYQLLLNKKMTSNQRNSECKLSFLVDDKQQGALYPILQVFEQMKPSKCLVLGIDLPHLNATHLADFVTAAEDMIQKNKHDAIAAESPFGQDAEPMCSLWSFSTSFELKSFLSNYDILEKKSLPCPRNFIKSLNVGLFSFADKSILANINTPLEYKLALELISHKSKSTIQEQIQSQTKLLKVSFFALLREQAGLSSIEFESCSHTPFEVYEELKKIYSFTLPHQSLRVAVNDKFSEWNVQLAAKDKITFIPPVAGG